MIYVAFPWIIFYSLEIWLSGRWSMSGLVITVVGDNLIIHHGDNKDEMYMDQDIMHRFYLTFQYWCRFTYSN